MKTFSQRQGYKPIRSLIQKESADEGLRNALWNALMLCYLDKVEKWLTSTDYSTLKLISSVWINHYGNRIDELNEQSEVFLRKLKSDFITSDWFEMYDILEFFPNNYEAYDGDKSDNKVNSDFVNLCNEVLEEHLSAYRFVDKLIVEITSEAEISTIEDALLINSKYETVTIHLRRSLELLSDRNNPDYRNSIKESISAIEAISCIIMNNPKATLGQALKEMEINFKLHPALKSTFSSLYGYTSDADGIRHSLLEESTLKQEDARFMLVTCSAFVNYLIVKTSEEKK